MHLRLKGDQKVSSFSAQRNILNYIVSFFPFSILFDNYVDIMLQTYTNMRASLEKQPINQAGFALLEQQTPHASQPSVMQALQQKVILPTFIESLLLYSKNNNLQCLNESRLEYHSSALLLNLSYE